VSDSGFAGLVIKVETSGNSFEIDACSGGTLTVSAGADWDEFVGFTIEKGLANLESLSGIPGTVGGAPIQNIGAYGHEVSEVIARVRTFDRKKQEVKTFTASQCEFGYRSSVFKTEANRYVILDVTFQLRIGEASLPIGYAELAKELGVEIGARVAITKVRDAVLKLRSAKGMLLGQGIKSAGSFFMNPILDKKIADKLPSDAPRWPMPDGRVKTSAAWLMEHAGVSKGDQIAGAQISPKHVLALSNAGDATAKDLVELAKSAQEKVRTKFGITLQTEVQLVGLSL
jgi:UDP-N-acetylmuramate dehydrogenase